MIVCDACGVHLGEKHHYVGNDCILEDGDETLADGIIRSRWTRTSLKSATFAQIYGASSDKLKEIVGRSFGNAVAGSFEEFLVGRIQKELEDRK